MILPDTVRAAVAKKAAIPTSQFPSTPPGPRTSQRRPPTLPGAGGRARQQHVDFGEQCCTGDCDHGETGGEAQSQQQPTEASRYVGAEHDRQHCPEGDERSGGEGQHELFERADGQVVLGVLDERRHNLVREATNLARRRRVPTEARVDDRLMLVAMSVVGVVDGGHS